MHTSSNSKIVNQNVVMNQKHYIVEECQRLQKSIVLVSDKYGGPLSMNSVRRPSLPFVLLLGNHSSGKSSFINHLIQRKVQLTGVAPTDDGFTVIGCGSEDLDRDGPSFVGDPSLGYSALQQFGTMLVNRTQLKIRTNLALTNVMLVDTPGMIDSPTGTNIDRGYDFEGVCKWYAERADVILFFFDPEKPGTTGETLSILTNSLIGMDHKLHIILNKADQFKSIHDFGRVYGSLTWNLSKVILRKDLPQIYTICLPGPSKPMMRQATLPDNVSASNHTASVKTVKGSVENPIADSSSPSDDFMQKFFDLESSRIEVVREVYNAPNRRVDHEISRLTDNIHLLMMHVKIFDDIVHEYHTCRLHSRLTYGFSCLGYGLCLTALRPERGGLKLGSLNVPKISTEMYIWSAITGLGVLIGLHFWQYNAIEKSAKELLSIRHLTNVYQRIYGREIEEKNEYIAALWKRIVGYIRSIAGVAKLSQMPRLKTEDLRLLETMLEKDVPHLRKQAVENYVNRTLPHGT